MKFNDRAALVALTEAVLKVRDERKTPSEVAEALDRAIDDATRAGAQSPKAVPSKLGTLKGRGKAPRDAEILRGTIRRPS